MGPARVPPRPRGYALTPAERRFRRSSWTGPCSTRSSASSPRASASARSPRRCRTRARVSEPALPLVCSPRCTRSSAARSSCSRPRTRTRATRPRPPAGSSATTGRASPEPRRAAGARASSRRRTSSASGPARSTCSRPAGSSAPRPRRSPRHAAARGAARSRFAFAPGDEPGIDALAEQLALAGYERVERAEERGQFAVRGGIVDVYPDHRAASRSASSSSATRSRASARSRRSPSARCTRSTRRRSIPAAERRLDLVESGSPTTTRLRAPVPDDLVPPLDRRPTSSGSRTRCARSGRRRGSTPSTSTSAVELDPLPRGQPLRVRGAAARDRRARARRGRERARARSSAAGLASSSRSRTAARRCARRTCCAASRPELLEPGEELPDEAELLFAVSPARRGFVWRELGLVLLPDTQVFRKPPPRPRRTGGPRAPVVRRPAHRRLRRPRGPRHRQAARLRDEARSRASRATTSSSPSAATTGSTSRTSRSARSRATSAPTRSRRRSRSSAARPGSSSRAARAPRCASWPASCLRSTRGARTRPGVAYDLSQDWLERLEAAFPYRETEDQRRGDRGREGGPRGAAPDGPPRLRRRRLRQDRGRGARRVRGRAQRQADADARADDRARAAALEHLPRALPRLPGRASRWSRASAGRPSRSRCWPTSPRARSTS